MTVWEGPVGVGAFTMAGSPRPVPSPQWMQRWLPLTRRSPLTPAECPTARLLKLPNEHTPLKVKAATRCD